MTESLLLTIHIISSYVFIIIMYNLVIDLYFNFFLLKLNVIGIFLLCFISVFNTVLMWFICCLFCAGFAVST
jgi:hypothetical protein